MQNGVPGLAAMFDWRKARPSLPAEPPTATPSKAPSGSTTSSASDPKSTPSWPALTAEQQTKLLQVNGMLTSEERALVQMVLGDLTRDQMQTWLDELDGLTVHEAVAQLRTQMQPKRKPDAKQARADKVTDSSKDVSATTSSKNGTAP
jgi:hypothetical protein